MAEFLDLPWEEVICRRIFVHLPVAAIRRLQIVNKSFAILIETFFRLCHVLDLRTSGKRSKFTGKSFISLTNQCESLRELHLSGCKRWLQDKLLIPVLSSNLMLKKFDISGCLDVTGSSIKTLALNCKYLQELNLSECRWLTSEALLVVGLECSKLKVLILSGCWNINNESVTTVFRNNTSLERIDIASCYGINGTTISEMAKSCKNLMYLDIRGCWRVGNDAIKTVREYCKYLRILSIKDCRDISEASLALLRLQGVEIDVQRPPVFQRHLAPIGYGEMIIAGENVLNLQV